MSNSNQTACVCPSGKALLNNECQTCKIFTFFRADTPDIGQLSCACPDEKVPSSDKTSCVCPHGKISVNDQCQICQNGKIPNPQKTACVCPSGQAFIDNQCQICQNGKMPNPDQTACICSAGTTFFNNICQTCKVNFNGLCCDLGQVNFNGLCCNMSQVNFNGFCAEKCPNSHINLDGICTNCENNQVPNFKQTACICPRGHTLEKNKCQIICKDGKIPNTDFGTNRAGGTGGTIAPCICPKGQAYLDFTFVVLGQLIEKFKCQDCPRGKIPNEDQTACVTPNIKGPKKKGKF